MYGYIYKTTNLVNGKIYIGQHKSQVFDRNYHGSGKLIHRAFEKYGIGNFKTELLKWCETRPDINKYEKIYIRIYHSDDLAVGYNISKGGDGGDTFSGLTDAEKEHRRKKMKMSMSGRIVINNGEIEKYVKSDELHDYLDNGFIEGCLHTPERDRIRSESKKRFYREHPDFRNSSMFEKGSSGFTGKHTEETKEKIRQKLIGTKQSEETRKLKSKLLKERYANGWQSPMKGRTPWNKGRKMTPEELKYRSEVRKGQIPWNKGLKSPKRIWMTNGVINKRVLESDLKDYSDAGFVKGVTRSN